MLNRSDNFHNKDIAQYCIKMEASEVKMNWDDLNKAEAKALFKQQCEIIFRRKGIEKKDQVDDILLRAGVTGIKKFNSWGPL